MTKLQRLETEEKRRVRGATPEEKELKAKQLSERAHVDLNATKQLQVCKQENWRGAALARAQLDLARFVRAL